jgi:hypothetical protein
VGKSISSAAFLYWYASFNFGKTIVIVANKEELAMEMVMRIRLMYEMTPLWLKPGVMDDGWNKHSVTFDNQSRIISTATAEDSGRGYAVSVLYCLGGETSVTIRDKVTGEVFVRSLEHLYEEL